MSKISLYACVLGLGFGGVVGGLYVHTLVKNLLIKFHMMLFLVAKAGKFDSCPTKNWPRGPKGRLQNLQSCAVKYMTSYDHSVVDNNNIHVQVYSSKHWAVHVCCDI